MFEEKKPRSVTFETKSRVKTVTVKWPFRDLKSYKEMHRETAKKKGCLEVFMAANTLTKARRILFG